MKKKYMRVLNLISLGILSISISNCASIVSGTTQTIYIQALDKNTFGRVPNASCLVKDSKGGSYPVYGNPSSIVISKSRGALYTECTAPGYHQIAVGTGENFDAWTIGNIFFWPGIIVDAATGAIQKYPDHVTVIMSKKMYRHSEVETVHHQTHNNR